MLWLLAAPFVLLVAMLCAALALLFYLGLFLAWLFGSLAREVRAAGDQPSAGERPPGRLSRRWGRLGGSPAGQALGPALGPAWARPGASGRWPQCGVRPRATDRRRRLSSSRR